MVKGRILVEGKASGPLLRLRHPISFWGGVDPKTGVICDPRHPDHGACVAGTVLAVPSAVGSSSSSAVILELIREGCAPAALILGSTDAIVALGVVVAGELGLPTLPVLQAPWGEVEALGPGEVSVSEEGNIEAGAGA